MNKEKTKEEAPNFKIIEFPYDKILLERGIIKSKDGVMLDEYVVQVHMHNLRSVIQECVDQEVAKARREEEEKTLKLVAHHFRQQNNVDAYHHCNFLLSQLTELKKEGL